MKKMPAGDISAREYGQDIRQPHHRILSLEVEGGFLDGTRLEFSDGLNCIIGGRGTGKTTVVEFIRYILGMMPDAADTLLDVPLTSLPVVTEAQVLAWLDQAYAMIPAGLKPRTLICGSNCRS